MSILLKFHYHLNGIPNNNNLISRLFGDRPQKSSYFAAYTVESHTILTVHWA